MLLDYGKLLTRSLQEPGGSCTKSVEVSESCMERVKCMWGGGGGGRWADTFIPRPEKNLWNNYHNGVGVLSSSTYKTDLLIADKQKKKGGGGVKEGDCDTFFPLT